ncbi:ATP-NAD kinase-like domain-containing protein [Tanacetum coccineum]|uniref:ATP-NAD kinase-like domain-containing protein n=1 Tax=Tanacetum coccineum TaxID=301880 RepID=A0ABQ5BS50_9ASTR
MFTFFTPSTRIIKHECEKLVQKLKDYRYLNKYTEVLAIEGKKKTLQFHFNTSSKTGAVDFTMDDVLDEATDINGTIEPTKELTVSAASQSLESTKLEDAGKTMLTGRLKKLYVFLNPYGGKKSASKIFSNDVKPLLEDANIEFTMQDPNLRSRYVLYFHGSQLLESLDVKAKLMLRRNFSSLLRRKADLDDSSFHNKMCYGVNFASDYTITLVMTILALIMLRRNLFRMVTP